MWETGLMKRLGFVVLAIFSILVVIGMVLDEDVQNASFREVMNGLGIAFAVIVLGVLWLVFRDTEATKQWWMDFGERHPFLKRIGQRLYRFYKTTFPPIRIAIWILPLALAAGVWWVIEYEDVQEYGRNNLSGYGLEGEEVKAGQGYTVLLLFIFAYVIATLVSTVKYILRRNKPLVVKNRSAYRWLHPEEFKEGGKYYELPPYKNPDH